ncbi:hypothetical protein ABMA70_06340 [Halobacteriovorax sp. XZX-3]|uniref:hypothetical protein n=1 Tax=unclassified Halobacteriovorax TaxID=2639665 RepID=UPI001304BF51|nr:hypothetical protein [Halobacteriovorax sp. DA5]
MSTEDNRLPKNFRNSPDLENFYRFIYENNLRSEAKKIFEALKVATTPVKKRGRKKKS